MLVGRERASDAREAATSCEGRGREVLTMRCGLGDWRPMSSNEVATHVGTSSERVRQIEAEAIQRMHHAAGVAPGTEGVGVKDASARSHRDNHTEAEAWSWRGSLGCKLGRTVTNAMRGPVPISRAAIRQHLINAGYSPEQIHEMLRELPDPVDFEHYAPLLEKLGVTIGSLIDEMGGGP